MLLQKHAAELRESNSERVSYNCGVVPWRALERGNTTRARTDQESMAEGRIGEPTGEPTCHVIRRI